MKTTEERIQELERLVSELSFRVALVESVQGNAALATTSPYLNGSDGYLINRGAAHMCTTHPTTGQSQWENFLFDPNVGAFTKAYYSH